MSNGFKDTSVTTGTRTHTLQIIIEKQSLSRMLFPLGHDTPNKEGDIIRQPHQWSNSQRWTEYIEKTITFKNPKGENVLSQTLTRFTEIKESSRRQKQNAKSNNIWHYSRIRCALDRPLRLGTPRRQNKKEGMFVCQLFFFSSHFNTQRARASVCVWILGNHYELLWSQL